MKIHEIEKLIRAEGGVAGEWRGSKESDLLVIGEAPGPTEEKEGRPFVGKAGQVLAAMLAEVGIEDFYITNVCKHFPGYKQGKIAKPLKIDKEKWWAFLQLEIAALRPKKILLLGEHAAKPMFFPGNWRMSEMAGVREERDGVSYWIAYHPASFLYNQGTTKNVRNMNKQRRILQDIAGAEDVSYEYKILPDNCISGLSFIDVETAGEKDARTAQITEWSMLREGNEFAELSFDPDTRPPRPDHAVFHNTMFDLTILSRQNPQWLTTPEIDDTLVMAYVLGYEDLSLKGLSSQLFGVRVFDYANREECGKETYNAQDVFLTRQLYESLLPQLPGSAYFIDRQLLPILVRTSLFSGYEIDHKKLEEVCEQLETEKAQIEVILQDWYPDLNPGSPAQLLEVLPVSDTKAETLRDLDTPEAHLILRWRQLAKDLSTYIYPNRHRDKLMGLFRLTLASGDEKDTDTGGAGTGRLSSHGPNMQNLDPVLQQCLRAPKGFKLLRADYGQIELRGAAEVSQSPYLIEALRDPDRNLHAETAELLGLSDYKSGKRWNFATLYGAEEYRMAQITGKPIEWCAQKIDEFRQGPWSDFFEWGDGHWERTKAVGYSESPTPFLHRRRIQTLDDKKGRKEAVNHPLQSHAAYITKAAMVELGKIGGLELVNQIHDEIHAFVPTKEAKEYARVVEEKMVEVGNQYLPSVGVTVDVKVGKSWEPKE